MYICVYICTHMHMYVYMTWEHCPPLCWPLLGVEGKHYWLSFSHVLLSFVQYVRWTTKTLTWPTQCALVCVFETFGFERVMSVCVRGSSFWCTMMYWLLAMAYVARFWEGNALPAIHLHPVWIHPTISNSHTTYICTRRHMFFPHKPPFSSLGLIGKCHDLSVRVWESEYVCAPVCVWGGGEGTKCVRWFGHFKCVMQFDLSLACSSSLRYTAMQFAVLGLVRLYIMLFLSLYVCLRCLLLPILFVKNVDDVA